MPHQGIKPVSVALRSDALPTELHPHVTSLCAYNTRLHLFGRNISHFSVELADVVLSGNPTLWSLCWCLLHSHLPCCFGQVQLKTLDVEEIDQIMRKVKNLKRIEADFSIACPQCYRVKVNGDQIRKINNAHRVIIGHDIDDQVIRFPGKTILKKDDWEMCGSVICKCKNRLGQMLIYKKVGCM